MDPAQTQAFLDLLEAIKNSGGEPAEQVKELAKAFSNLNAQQIEAVKSSGALTAEQERAANAKLRNLEQTKLSAQAQLDEAEAIKRTAEATKNKEKILKAEAEAIKTRIQLLKAQSAAEPDPSAREAINSLIDEENEKLEKNAEALKNTTQRTGELKKALQDLAVGLGEVGKSMFAGEESGKKFMSAIGGIGDKAISSIQGKLVSSFGKAGPAMAAAIGVLYEFGKAVVQLAIQMSDASKEIQKATGVSDSFAKSIVSGYEETRRFGGSLKELTAAGTELSKTFTDFTMMNEDAARSLAVTATMMGKLGVSNADFAKGIQLSTKALGATTEQAQQTQLNLAQLAMDIGVAPSQMAADFASAGPHLAKFGSDAERAFKSLAITAKSTSIDVGRLLQITEKFDTFEGAAEQAGKLNAALGGNFVNAMEMMTETDPAARFEMMTGAIKEAGLSFDDMSYYQRKFYADAMGLADVSELAAALSGNTEALGKEARMTSADYEEMAKRAATVQNFQERLNMVFAEMIPIVEPLVEMLEGMVEFMGENKEMVKAFGVAFAVLGAGIAMATAPISLSALAIAGVTAAIAGLLYYVFHKRNSPTFAESFDYIADKAASMTDALDKIRNPFGFLSSDIDEFNDKMLHNDGLTANLKATTKTMHEFDNATMKTAQTTKAAAPVLATSGAVSSAMNSYTSSTTNTTNNNGGGATKVEIGLAEGFKDMFSAKVISSVATTGMGGLL